jgi:NSS family neurotransmitter:Na+ symporter
VIKKRNQFSSKFGFIAAAAGSAVGLGNIWKFPFEVGQNGGAAFLIVYLIFSFVLCYPLLITEIAIGRSAQKSPVGAFKAIHHREWTFMGILGVMCGILILSFYNVVAAWVLAYFVEMLLGNFDVGGKFADFVNEIDMIGGYSLFILALVAFIVSRGVTRGIEKASKILMPVLIGILIFLIIYSLTLDRALEGIQFYLVPDFSKINIEVIYRALGQAFFSLSLGMGILITYGSYLKRKEDIVFSGAVITLADILIAFLAGLMIFPIVFSQNIDTAGGAGLIFITMPGIFATMGPFWGILIGALFFLLLAFAAITSIISLLELPVSYLVDQHEIKRDYAVWISAGFIFLLGIPSLLSKGYSDYFTQFITYYGSEASIDFMTFLTDVSSNTLLPFVGFLTSIFTIYVWKRKKLFRELRHGSDGFENSWISKYIGICVQFIAPLVLGITFILTILEIFFGLSLFA